MTNHWIDLKNSDCILIMGSNAAENHPISMKYVTEAQSRGGKLISVDPRFTRTSAKADIYAPLRSGTDIAFLGGMIKYIIDNKLYNEEDVVAYSDAAFLVGDGSISRTGSIRATIRASGPMMRASGPTSWTRTAFPRRI